MFRIVVVRLVAVPTGRLTDLTLHNEKSVRRVTFSLSDVIVHCHTLDSPSHKNAPSAPPPCPCTLAETDYIATSTTSRPPIIYPPTTHKTAREQNSSLTSHTRTKLLPLHFCSLFGERQEVGAGVFSSRRRKRTTTDSVECLLSVHECVVLVDLI